MFFFPLCFSQSAATWFLHQSPYCFGFSHFSDAYPSTSQVSKLWHPISNALCNYVIFYCTCDWLRFNIGRDKPTNSQHKLPPYRKENVCHFRNFCLRLAGRGPSTTVGNPNPRYFCINVCTVTVCLTSTDSPMLWSNFPINQSIYFRGSQNIVWLGPKWFPITKASSFQSIQLSFNANCNCQLNREPSGKCSNQWLNSPIILYQFRVSDYHNISK